MQISLNRRTAQATAAQPTVAKEPAAERTALQKHVDYFDRNGDGQIQMHETYQGFRKLGVGIGKSAVSAAFINIALGLKTSSHWTRPFTIDTANIHKGKHDSDTDTYDGNGDYVSAKHEAIFTDFDANKDAALSQTEIDTMIATKKETRLGAFAAKQEFGLLMQVGGTDTPAGRVITRETLGGLYDGTLFYKLAGETPPSA